MSHWKASTWQKLSVAGLSYRLHTPPTGPLYAQQPGGIQRSDDAGLTWTRVKVPAPPDDPNAIRVFATNPADHATMYTTSATGLQRAVNGDDASWQTIAETPELPYSLAVSPADPSLMYLGVTMKPVQQSTSSRLLRSRDGGSSWDVLSSWGAGSVTNIGRLQAHLLDAMRVFRTDRFQQAPGSVAALMQSRDQGITWNVSFNRPQHSVDAFTGGAGANPQRFYMTIWQHLTSNSPILRSDDDAVSWHDVIPPWSFLELPSDAERTAIRGLTYDPQNPDRVYVGVNIHRSNRTPGVPSFLFSRVMASNDGGESWLDLGFENPAEIADLKFGIDGKFLFAASGQGVWRLAM